MRQTVVDGTILIVETDNSPKGSERSRHMSAEGNKVVSWRLQEEVFG
jgi:hypothetical protein